jgi:hypothetical protein
MSSHVTSDDLKRYFLKDKFAVYVGIELLSVGDGKEGQSSISSSII